MQITGIRNGSPFYSSRLATLLLLSVVVDIVVVAQDTTGCTLCADGSEPMEGASFGGTNCRDIAAILGETPADSAECGTIQKEGYAYCGCPTLPESYCSMCEYTSDTGYVALPDKFQDLIVPGTSDVKCRDIEFVLAQDGAVSCEQAKDAAFFCGCASAARLSECYLCGTNGSAATVNDRLLPPTYSVSCAAVDREIGAQSNGECAATNEALPQVINSTAYCGCFDDGSAAAPVGENVLCRLCGDDQEVLNPNGRSIEGSSISCRELAIAAAYVTDGDYCTSLQSEVNDTCCVMESRDPINNGTVAPPSTGTSDDSNATDSTISPPNDSNATQSPATTAVTEVVPGTVSEVSAAPTPTFAAACMLPLWLVIGYICAVLAV